MRQETRARAPVKMERLLLRCVEPIGRLVGGRLSENYLRSPLDNVCCCDYHRCHWEAAGMAA